MVEGAPAIEAVGLVRRFGEFTAVDGISFAVQRGEVFGLLGPNGCGKTTTIRMLCGVLPPSAGTAQVLGFNVSRQADDVKHRIGYMSQRAALYDDLTVREHLLFYGGLYGLDARTRREAADEYLAATGLAARADALVGQLPGGLRQRLAFGCASLHRPALLILDEPTAGVDPVARRAFWEQLHALAQVGTTVFVTTHFMEEAEYCHTLGLMHRGRLVAWGSPTDLKVGLPHTLLEIESASPHEALDVVEALPSVAEVALYGTLVHCLVRPGTAPAVAIATVREALAGAGVAATRVEQVPPSLEDVFAAATGGAA